MTGMSWESMAVRGAVLENAGDAALMGGSARHAVSCVLVDMSVTVGSGPRHRRPLLRQRIPTESGHSR